MTMSLGPIWLAVVGQLLMVVALMMTCARLERRLSRLERIRSGEEKIG